MHPFCHSLILIAIVFAEAIPAHAQELMQGLRPDERGQFYHTPEGSEVFPLAWLQALESSSTHRPFLDNVERFGFLPDAPDARMNPHGLPIGLTATQSMDTRFAGVLMVGVNCALCHVGELTYKGQRLRLLGAPNLADIEGYREELTRSVLDTAASPEALMAFLKRLARQSGSRSPSQDVGRGLEGRLFLVQVPPLEKLEGLGPLEKRLAAQIRAQVQKEAARPPHDLREGLRARPPTRESTTDLTFLLREAPRSLLGDLASRADVDPAPAGPLAAITPGERLRVLDGFFSDLVLTVRLLRARAALLGQGIVARIGPPPVPGFGRADAFGRARNTAFPEEPIAMDAAVSYPHLWGFGDLTWLHWDANTNSVMERNLGQAIGLGAVFDLKTGTSTLLPREIYGLEMLARKITPPAWPEEILGKIDRSRFARGERLFEAQCRRCHPTDGGARTDLLSAVADIGTDAGRAQSFAGTVGGRPFAEALAQVLGALKEKAYQVHGIVPDERQRMELSRVPAVWRTTRAYPGRPLRSIWATPPYLHNGSVPTLYDLLLPAAQRPRTFRLGEREYDPIKLGYAASGRGWVFDTQGPGNGNSGHEFGSKLSKSERMDLLEYLKGT